MSPSRTASLSGRRMSLDSRLVKETYLRPCHFFFEIFQIWAGTDQCEPVSWQECELIEKDVQFIVPDVSCSNKQELWYHVPEPTKSTRMAKTFSCEVKKSSHCTTQTRPDCKQITYNECK